jgi:hypothetical protein
MNKVRNILICMVISLLFACGIGNAVTCGENGLVCPGQPGVCSDGLLILNNTVFDLKAGEEQNIIINFYRPNCFYDYGEGKVSYEVSDTPLNVTVPSEFFTTSDHGQYPGIIKVHANPNLAPGNYSFFLTVVGTQGSFTSTPPGLFFVNVKPNGESPFSLQRSPLSIILPVLALVAIIACCRGIQKRKQ